MTPEELETMLNTFTEEDVTELIKSTQSRPRLMHQVMVAGREVARFEDEAHAESIASFIQSKLNMNAKLREIVATSEQRLLVPIKKKNVLSPSDVIPDGEEVEIADYVKKFTGLNNNVRGPSDVYITHPISLETPSYGVNTSYNMHIEPGVDVSGTRIAFVKRLYAPGEVLSKEFMGIQYVNANEYIATSEMPTDFPIYRLRTLSGVGIDTMIVDHIVYKKYKGLTYCFGPDGTSEGDEITTVHIMEGCDIVGGNSFSRTHNVERVILASTVKKISEYAFYEYRSSTIKEVVLNEGLEEIAKYAFPDMDGEIRCIRTMPKSLVHIGTQNFQFTGVTADLSNLDEFNPLQFKNCNITLSKKQVRNYFINKTGTRIDIKEE